VIWSISKTPQYPPSPEEMAALKERNKCMPHPAIQFFLSILTTLVAYLVLFLLLIPSIFDRKIILKTIF
jgi:maltose/moltooligosaccharide transporter